MLIKKYILNKIIIANPIYDTVFKYLMDDLESAKIIIATLINQPIISLKAITNDIVAIEENETADKYIHLMRLDFTAEILNADNTKELVSIELQKARLKTDELRFRKYIAENLKKTEVIIEKEINPTTLKPYTKEKAYRFIPIFILNFEIETEIFDLVIETQHTIKGVFTGKELQTKNDFLDNLMYNVIVVQIPYINKIKTDELENNPYKLALYNLFQLFNQSHIIGSDKHSLFIEENESTKDYLRIVKRLANIKANEPQLEQKLILEDTMLKEILEMQHDNFYNKKLIQEQKIQLAEKDKIIDEKDKALDEAKKIMNEKEKLIAELKKQINKNIN